MQSKDSIFTARRALLLNVIVQVEVIVGMVYDTQHLILYHIILYRIIQCNLSNTNVIGCARMKLKE